MTNLVETYLKELRDIHLTGAASEETSYYAPLANLLNGISKTAKLRVRCIINPRNQGGGLPDGGFSTSDQIRRDTTCFAPCCSPSMSHRSYRSHHVVSRFRM